MNQTYCKLRNEFKLFNGNSEKSLNLAWTKLTLFFPIYFSVVNKKQSVQFFFSLYLTLLLLFLVWIICPRLYCVEKKNGESFWITIWETYSSLPARIDSGRADGCVCDNPSSLHSVGSEQEVGETGIILLFGKESRPRWKLQVKKTRVRKLESIPQEAQWSTVHGSYLS